MNTQSMSLYELLSLIVAALALCGSIYSFFLSKKTLKSNTQMSFFAEYTKRYQEIEIGLMSNDDKQRNTFYRLYIDLCSEEYYLNSRKCLPPDVWNMWLDGMKLIIKVKELQLVWQTSSQLYNQDFCNFFDNLIKKSNQLK